jgi:1-acyl-sn-glycerol-3-phosphate acyltransferase
VVEDVGEAVPPVDGEDLQLSIDSKVQFFAYQRLREAVLENKAKAGSVVVLDATDGSTVADALREGEVVCLFPEGELTRDGKMVPLQKGFELILRQAGCPAMPVFLDGLWGSIFSYEGGTVFRKWPKKLRYPCVVHFGPVLEVKEATVERVTGEFTEMLKKTQTGTV